MNFGDTHKERYGECSKETAFDILDHFFENGGNFLDTANAYQGGQSEQWLGEWIKSRDNRDQLVLATKFSSPYLVSDKTKIKSNLGGNGAKSMRLSLEASLKRLQTDYIDLFYLHWWDYTVSIPELMHNLNDLCAAGKILYLGISDTPAYIVSKANQYARDHGLRQFVVYQGNWNAALRDFEREIIPMCRDEGMGLCPYGTLNQGRFQTEAVFEEREKSNPGRNFTPTSERDKKVSKVLESVAESKGPDSKLTDIALAYVFHKTPYVFPIVGGRKLDHIKGNIAALKMSLTEGDIKQIDSAYDFDYGFPHTFLSGSMFEGATPRPANGPGDVWLTKGFGEIDWVAAPGPIR